MAEQIQISENFTLEFISYEEGYSSSFAPDAKGAFALRRDGEFVQTPKGKLLVHPSQPLLTAIADELDAVWPPNASILSLYSLYSTMVDFVSKTPVAQRSAIEPMIYGDASLSLAPGPEAAQQMIRTQPLNHYLQSHDLPRLGLSASGDWEANKKNLEGAELEAGERIVDHFLEAWNALGYAQRTIAKNALNIHGTFTLGFLLATGNCTVDDYAKSALAIHQKDPCIFNGIELMEGIRIRNLFQTDAMIFQLFVALEKLTSDPELSAASD